MVGRSAAQAERAAETRARAAERKLGMRSRPAAQPDHGDHDFKAPPSVTRIAKSPGNPLPDRQRSTMEHAFGHDFAQVRIHSDTASKQAAQGIGARAFTIGSHIALPDAQPGILTHELGHVVANERGEDRPGMVRRIGVGEWFARLVGEGTYSEVELQNYLMKLETSGKIEDSSESDDKARQVVRHGMHKSLSSDAAKSRDLRRLLIEEMMSGFTGNEDEEAILKILEDSPMPEREWLVNTIGISRLEDEFHGDQFDKLQALIGGVYKAREAPVPLNWSIGYQLRGPERAMKRRNGVILRSLSFRPAGADSSTTVASDEDLVLDSGKTKDLTQDKPIDHPRKKGGEGFADLQVGPVDENELVVPETDVRWTVKPVTYPPIDPLKSRVQANLDIEMRELERSTSEVRTGTRTTTATGTRESKSVAKGRESSVEDSAEVEKEASRTDTRTLDYEQRLAKKTERETSKTESKTQSEEKEKETQKKKEETKSESKTEGSETSGQTEKIGGSAEFKGKMDAKFKAEIEKASTPLWVTATRWILKLGKLAPGQYGKILRILGPIGDKILDLFEPGEDDLEIEVDGEGNFELRGTFKANKSVQGWRKFKSTTKGTAKTEGKTDIERKKEGSSVTKGTGQAEREGEEASEALKQGAGVSEGQRVGVKQGRKVGSRESEVNTVTKEKFEETRQEKFREEAEMTKNWVAEIKDATLSFKVM